MKVKQLKIMLLNLFFGMIKRKPSLDQSILIGELIGLKPVKVHK